MKRLFFILIAIIVPCLVSPAFATIHQVRVVNDTDAVIYIHKGGYAVSVSIMPGQWKIFPYPFTVIPPGETQPVTSSLLVATSGGRWVTDPNGYTSLNEPNLTLCLDYNSPEYKDKTGNRVWVIKLTSGYDKDCKVQGYKQPWYQKQEQKQDQKQDQKQEK